MFLPTLCGSDLSPYLRVMGCSYAVTVGTHQIALVRFGDKLFHCPTIVLANAKHLLVGVSMVKIETAERKGVSAIAAFPALILD